MLNYGPLHGQLKRIEVADFGYEIHRCWFNALHHSHKDVGGGDAIFGWAIWEQEDGASFLAQHHAVWQRPNGKELVDITPNQEGAPITVFVADERAPFGVAPLKGVPHMKFPFGLRWFPGSHRIHWETHDPARGIVELPDFHVNAGKPEDPLLNYLGTTTTKTGLVF